MSPEAAACAADLHAAAFAGAERPWSAAEIAALAAGSGAFFLLTPQALLLGRIAADEAELLTLAVHPDARRKGLGRRLLREFEARAAAAGAVTAFLEVAADNAAARALYAAAGWDEAGRRRGYYRRPGARAVDAVVLRRQLTPKATAE